MFTVTSSINCRDAAIQSITRQCRAQALPFYLRQRSRFHNSSISYENDTQQSQVIPLRKELKEEAKQRRAAKTSVTNDIKSSDQRTGHWELTVGIEVHAQLDSESKLFSRAATSINDRPNSHVSVFDLAFPGSQPKFQKKTLIPAIRAACALNCDIALRSNFDRKHYFYQDQPAGYQITQYYKPFATDGRICIYDHDGIDPADGDYISLGIKQIQLEQDTAKTTQEINSTSLLDFNRVSHALIEIITLPQIHYPKTAAACVKKIQSILEAVGAVSTGMEMGGLRVDVNVSVRPRAEVCIKVKDPTYTGPQGLGQRTEIKNLNSLKAVEDAIVAERDRQIGVLESGGIIVGETRGWRLGATKTTKLRGKEGEVDYRYLPDPDIPPLEIDPVLIGHLANTLPMLPHQTLYEFCDMLMLNQSDAKTLIALNDGERLDFFDKVLYQLGASAKDIQKALNNKSHELVRRRRLYARTAANWVLHEIGGLLTVSKVPFSESKVSVMAMASIVKNLVENRITGKTAKELLSMAFNGDSRDIESIIKEENLELQSLSRDVYLSMARDLIAEHEKLARRITQLQDHKKLRFFTGQLIQRGFGKIEPQKAEAVLKELLNIVDT